ncbi:hypothetical protein MPDQ_006326 [Monascus purpureus]|uniref:Acyl-CoA thioesterase 8 n=1 Tax=Monascus purpureus TaxID=5098 RepID=A0A507QV27_MONPU|nr:hypothetical protein MPDQ_006326 [Monascus purpureus]BDD59706.1 hypothetical protein MAP00_004899 [Monascus purpureus]
MDSSAANSNGPPTPGGRIEPPPPPLSFVNLMALERLDDPNNRPDGDNEKIEKFRSLATPYTPVTGPRVFGGHIYAQSAYAASKTVKRGFVIHNISGSFIRQGRNYTPFAYTVRHIRDGRNYCVRAVDARQKGKICFSCICSFKRAERQTPFRHQPAPAQETYRAILDRKRPEDHPLSPCIDVDWWMQQVEEGSVSEQIFPGLYARKADMKGYNETDDVKKNPEKYRQLMIYCLRGSPDESAAVSADNTGLKEKDKSGEYDNLYACAHLYASDKNSLFLAARALGHQTYSAMASLSLTVIFHEHGEALRMIDWDAESQQKDEPSSRKWFIQEAWTPRSGDNRVVHESRLWSPDGTLLATTLQDGQLRLHEREGKL